MIFKSVIKYKALMEVQGKFDLINNFSPVYINFNDYFFQLVDNKTSEINQNEPTQLDNALTMTCEKFLNLKLM